ncbi:threonine aldolase [Aliidiomarina sedimenti]|uniref:Threonine aldolase n=1 Tax=Aliidiomarina sedimenti TaxID=1933879 RepID=A0ABY0BX97_9GAMM|nr:beta-eliminating lyase-related protein [Aliidiomarina sedimenti]RUO28805.1 threonine aldolase [Aliidiomarina sedimenti]
MAFADARLQQAYKDAARQVKFSILRHPQRSMSEVLLGLSERAKNVPEADYYGQGELIEGFEHDLATRFGKEAALFLPSGTMAQPLALRIHCDERHNNRVALHPSSHLLLHEESGYRKLWQLQKLQYGPADRPARLSDCKAWPAQQRPAAMVYELPLRELGGALPSWQSLHEQAQWAKRHQIALHIDGARIWQCAAAYQRSLADIAELADSLYVSFYKDIGGIAGAALLGDADFIQKARVWARRAGGNLYAFYPYVLAAQQGMDDNLDAISEAVSYTAVLAPALAEIEGIELIPAEPQCAMFHIRIELPPSQLMTQVIAYARQHDVLMLPMPRQHGANHCVFEISVGRNALAQPVEFWQSHMRNLLQSSGLA